MTTENIVEIQIRRVKQLSEAAKMEVEEKLKSVPEDFEFRGYAKVSYAESSPLRVVSVDPLEGTIFDYFKSITRQIGKN
jgi:hypothetical protein